MDAGTARTLLEDEARRLDQLLAHAAPPVDAEAEPDVTDAGSALLDHEVDRALHQRIVDDRDAITAALARLAIGAYGRCEACGVAIVDARLEAVPATRFCVDHEQEAETLVGAGIEGSTGGADAAEALRLEAQRHLDLIPDDDADEQRDPLSAEERAIHIRAER